MAAGNAGRPQSPEETRNKSISGKKDLEGFLVAQQFEKKKKKSTCNAGDVGDRDLTGSGRSPGEGNGYALQYSCLERTRRWTEEPGGLESIGSQRVGQD